MTARDRTVLIVLGMVAMLAAFWFLALGPRREEAKSLGDKVAAAQQRLDTARQTAATAEHAREQYDGDYATVAKLGKAVPVDDDVPSLVYQIEHASDRAKVDFRSIKLSASGSAPAAAPAATPAQQAADLGKAQKDDSTSPGGSTPVTPPATDTPAAATQTAAAALPPGASVGPAGFPTMPFDFSFTGSFFRLEGFLKALDRFTVLKGDQIKVRGRLLTVDGISLTAAASGFPRMSAQIHATAYLLPSDQGLTNGATPSAPGTPAAAPASSTGSGSTASPTATATITGGR